MRSQSFRPWPEDEGFFERRDGRCGMNRVAIVEHALDAQVLVSEVAHAGAGATSVFIGAVRDSNAGRPVSGIEYTAYAAMAERELGAIAAEAESLAPGVRIVVEHRIGSLGIGDASVVIAVSHPHRAEAISTCSFVIEELKRRVPVWKREHYLDGTREWVHASVAAKSLDPAPAPWADLNRAPTAHAAGNA